MKGLTKQEDLSLERPTTKVKRRKAQIPAEELNVLIIEAIQEKKGLDIVRLDLRALEEAPTDFFIVCHATNENQVKAIANNIQYELKTKVNELPSHVEGLGNSVWVLVDYFDIIVHVFHKDAREFYNLEALWSDAKTTEYQNL